ncbi:MAG: DUF3618 domain-containing protein [Sulfitobacter sp.]
MTNETRSPAEIEREIERERAGLTSTLDDLQDRFSVESIARQFSDQFREHGGDIGRSVSEAVKRNPVALAVTGAGLAWLMLGDKTRDLRPAPRPEAPRPAGRALGPQPGNSRTPQQPYYSGRKTDPSEAPDWARASDADDGSNRDGATAKLRSAASTAGENVSNAAHSAADRASDAGKSIADGARDMASTAQERAAALRDRLAEGTESLSQEARDRVIAARERAVEARAAANSYARQTRDRAADVYDDQPLVAGALALAVGAAIAAALPRSRVEDAYLGDHSDALISEAERVFAEEKQKLGKVAKAATAEAKSVAQDVSDEASNLASTALDKAKGTAKHSGERIADAAESEAKKQNLGAVKTS